MLRLGRYLISFEHVPRHERLRWELGSTTAEDIVLFYGQLAALYTAGISFVRSLTILSRQATNRKLALILDAVRHDINGGSTLSHSMSRHSGTFNALEIQIIKVGEAVGDLPLVLERLALLGRRHLELTRKIKSMMTYPLIVFCASLALIGFLACFLFNTIFPALAAQGIELPAATRVLMLIAAALKNPLAGLLVLAACFMAFRLSCFLFSLPFFRELLDRFIWNLPLLGKTLQKIFMARFCYNFGLMYEHGVGILKILAIEATSSSNSILRAALLRAIDSLKEGDSIAESLKREGIFPKSLIDFLAIGESSGTIPYCMKKLAEYYETEVSYSVENLSSALEPLMIGGMGVFVGLVIMVVLSPLYGVIANLGL
ncbi:MAG: type II secretion system F family protein [Candidatus Eremiobacteraeota bacterium]|nr:type II secretion system F family protein [Candidatus Eremiobacteraeota bacterium]